MIEVMFRKEHRKFTYTHDFEPYGVEIPPYNESASNSHKFTGHERDAGTGYDYMHFRYYASTIGRFMKPDNVTGSPLNQQNWNLYSYVRGNPVNNNDPDGHEVVTTIVVVSTIALIAYSGWKLYKYHKEKDNSREKAQKESAIEKADKLEAGKQISGKWNEDNAEIAIKEGQKVMDVVEPAASTVVPAAPGGIFGSIETWAMDLGAKILGIDEKKSDKDKNEQKKEKDLEKEATLPQETPGENMDEPPTQEEVKK